MKKRWVCYSTATPKWYIFIKVFNKTASGALPILQQSFSSNTGWIVFYVKESWILCPPVHALYSTRFSCVSNLACCCCFTSTQTCTQFPTLLAFQLWLRVSLQQAAECHTLSSRFSWHLWVICPSLTFMRKSGWPGCASKAASLQKEKAACIQETILHLTVKSLLESAFPTSKKAIQE